MRNYLLLPDTWVFYTLAVTLFVTLVCNHYDNSKQGQTNLSAAITCLGILLYYATTFVQIIIWLFEGQFPPQIIMCSLMIILVGMLALGIQEKLYQTYKTTKQQKN